MQSAVVGYDFAHNAALAVVRVLDPHATMDIAVRRVLDDGLHLIGGSVEHIDRVLGVGRVPHFLTVGTEQGVVGGETDRDDVRDAHGLQVDDGAGAALLVVTGAFALVGGVQFALVVRDLCAPRAGACLHLTLDLHRCQIDLVDACIAA